MVILEYMKKPSLSSYPFKKIKLVSNLLSVITMPKVLFHYQISITPEVSRKKIPGLFHRIIQLSDVNLFNGVNYAFDGISMLVTDRKLNEDITTFQTEYGFQKTKLILEVKYKNEYHMSDLVDYMKTTYMGNINTHLQCLEVIMRHHNQSKYVREGSRCFDVSKSTPLTNKILMHAGLAQTFKITSMGLLNNIDLSFYLTYASLNIIDVISEISTQSERSYSRSYEFDECLISDTLKKEGSLYRSILTLIKVARLQTIHRKGKAFSFKASGICLKSSEEISFICDENEISVKDYFEQKYGKLKYPRLPCIVKKGRDGTPVYFPMECLRIAPNQKYDKNLTENEVTEVIKHASKPPNERFESIKNQIRESQILDNETVKKFNLTFGDDFVKCTGLMLEPPTIEFGAPNNLRITPDNGSWNIRNCSAFKGAKVSNWMVSYLVDTQLRISDINTGIDALIHYGRKFGVILSTNFVIKSVSKPSEYIHLLDAYKPDLVFFILPTRHRNDTYTRIKTISETNERMVITQCIKSTNFKKLIDASFSANIIIKINSKLKGINWRLSDLNLKVLNSKSTIIFGADVCHSGVGENMLDSVVAVTGSIDPTFSDYNVEIKYQNKNEEIISDLHSIVRKLLIMNYAQTKIKPKRIIFFRDGVGESQYNTVMEKEITEIQKACQILQESYKPLITYIIAQKRHHVRFKALDISNLNTRQKNKGNPLPGTVVEEISHPFVFDFYMINHSAFQGTARPVKYTVLYDDANLSREDIYTIIHNLCHTYARTTKSVSLVTPIMYAHLAAGRGKLYLKDDKNIKPKLTEELKSTCFYN